MALQEYIRDLEKKEEEAKQLEKEKKRRQERKNRDAFRDLMNEHKAAGELSAKTKWKDYLETVRIYGLCRRLIRFMKLGVFSLVNLSKACCFLESLF